jgi:hypothetical protein
LRNAATFFCKRAKRNRMAAIDQRRRRIAPQQASERRLAHGVWNFVAQEKIRNARKKIWCGDCIRDLIWISFALVRAA